jgi:hypothetical protein
MDNCPQVVVTSRPYLESGPEQIQHPVVACSSEALSPNHPARLHSLRGWAVRIEVSQCWLIGRCNSFSSPSMGEG